MRIGELLVASKLVSKGQIDAALNRQVTHGGVLGQNLVSLGAIEQDVLDRFLAAIPKAPLSVEATGLDQADLIDLLLRVMVRRDLSALADFTHALRLTTEVTVDLLDAAVREGLLEVTVAGPRDSHGGSRYDLTEDGRRRAAGALAASSYVGPAPVSLDSYRRQLQRQKLTNEMIDRPRMLNVLSGLEVSESVVQRLGAAVRSGRPMLLYGPPGNGKSAIAQRLGRIFEDIIYVPRAVMVEGQVMEVFDPDIHTPVDLQGQTIDHALAWLRREDLDTRWVACLRPVVATGAELTPEMLDLWLDDETGIYHAPLHLKASGGFLLIDDFGRQVVATSGLLNRWFAALEHRRETLKLRNGRVVPVPFEAMVIFVTNQDPSTLMDAAFLRRLPYKVEIGPPDLPAYRRIFEAAAAASGLTLTDEIFAHVVDRIVHARGEALAAFQPTFIVSQVIEFCRFNNRPPEFDPQYVDYAIESLSLRAPDAANQFRPRSGPGAVDG